MRIPNYERAIIHRRKLKDYLLNIEHEDGGAKARLLYRLGYRRQVPEQLEADLRSQHLPLDVTRLTETKYGIQYVIVAPLTPPTQQVRLFRSVWQIDHGADAPRFITLVPE